MPAPAPGRALADAPSLAAEDTVRDFNQVIRPGRVILPTSFRPTAQSMSHDDRAAADSSSSLVQEGRAATEGIVSWEGVHVQDGGEDEAAAERGWRM